MADLRDVFAHMPGVIKVALLVETARGYGRDVLRGIVRYARLHGPWAFYITPGDFEQALPRMEKWGGTGIIARIETHRVAKSILATGLPVVAMDLSEEQLSSTSPLVAGLPVEFGFGGSRAVGGRALEGQGLSELCLCGRCREGLVRSAAREFLPPPGHVRLLATHLPEHNPTPTTVEPRTGNHGRLAGRSAQAGGDHGLRRRPGPRGPGGLSDSQGPRP